MTLKTFYAVKCVKANPVMQKKHPAPFWVRPFTKEDEKDWTWGPNPEWLPCSEPHLLKSLLEARSLARKYAKGTKGCTFHVARFDEEIIPVIIAES